MPEKRRILIIDDEEDVCKLCQTILEKTERFKALYSIGAREGINLVKNWKPHLILLDISMPEMDGGDVANCLSKDHETKDTPILFLTALARKTDTEGGSGKTAGHFFITKSVTPSELITRIDAILDRGRREGSS